MPAICSTFLGVRAATIPAPRGAGIRRMVTLPHLPVTLVGTVCTCSTPHRHRGHDSKIKLSKTVSHHQKWGSHVVHTDAADALMQPTHCERTGAHTQSCHVTRIPKTMCMRNSETLIMPHAHLSDLVTPVATAHGNDAHLGQDDGTADGSGNLQHNRHTQKE